MSRDALLRYRAERLLRSDFSGLRTRVTATVRSRLRTRGVQLDWQDLDACYAQAWQGLYSRLLAGEQVEDLAAWLVLATYRRALDELRARSRHGRLCEAGAELVQACGSGSARGGDLAAELDDRARLRHVLEALNDSLSRRERQAASLCYLQGLSRAQAAQRMGMSQARMRKLMDGFSGRTGVAAKVQAALETIGAGRWCEQQGSLLRAYAFGILDPQGERHALARAHLRECPACRAFVRSLRGLATVLPPLPLPLAFSRSPKRARSLHSTARSAPLAKLAAVGLVGLSLGGGFAVVAVRAPGRASGPAPFAGRPAHAQHRPRPFPAHRRRRHDNRPRKPAVASPRRLVQHRGSRPARVAISGPPPHPTVSGARVPLEEFSPESARPRPG
jgi:DNA-directed RNA polymerase specialized sigma24 family protein